MAENDGYRLDDRVLGQVRLQVGNLLDPALLAHEPPYDFVFCRNVVIYFDKETQRKLFDRIADLLVPGGWLYIGHSESLFQVSDRFRLSGKTIYQQVR